MLHLYWARRPQAKLSKPAFVKAETRVKMYVSKKRKYIIQTVGFKSSIFDKPKG